VGGAQDRNKKNNRNKKATDAARAVAAARGARNDRRNIIIGIAAVVVVAVAVVVGVLMTQQQVDQSKVDSIAVVKAPAEYGAVVQSDGTVVAGKDTAKVKLDLYEDFLCPYCGKLEQTYGTQITQAIVAGKVEVRYHLLNLLDQNSNPPGYSTLAANAAIAAAKQGKFADYHASLYAQQPQEKGPGYTNAQLISLGQRVGITAQQFSDDVNKGTYSVLAGKQLATASAPPVSLQGTPTVRNGNTNVDISDPQWLDKLLQAAANS
jgi:protein-disulfide isomerase